MQETYNRESINYTKDEILEILSTPSTHVDILISLSKIEDEDTYLNLSKNIRAATALLNLNLSLPFIQNNNLLKKYLCQNISAPAEILDQLARDKHNDEHNKIFIARHPNTSSKTLVYLLKYDGVEMMGAIAEHPNTSPEILELMVKSSEKLYTLYKLAQNPHTPPEALDELAEDSDDEEVKLAIAQNPNALQSTLLNLFNENSLISIEAKKNYEYQEILDRK